MKDNMLKQYKKIKRNKLLSALVIDLVGLATYYTPLLGESGDIIWGPISGLLIYTLFRKRKKLAISGALEELFPFLDFIPTASVAWILEYVKDKEKTMEEFLAESNDLADE